jgi:hypothetical protein
MYEAGKPMKVIAARIGMTRQGVSVHLHAAGIDVGTKRRALDREYRERFAKTWNAAANLNEVVAASGRSKNSASAYAVMLRNRYGLLLKHMPKRSGPVPAPLGDRVAELLHKGLSNREVMRRSGASLATVVQVRKRIGLLTLPRWTPEEDALLPKLGYAEVARRTGRSATAARHRLSLLRRMGRV